MKHEKMGVICSVIVFLLAAQSVWIGGSTFSPGLAEPQGNGISGVEVVYNPNPPPVLLPVERWTKYGVRVYNRGSKPVHLSFDVRVVEEDRGLSPFPQPPELYLEPGENQTIWYFVEIAQAAEGTYHVLVKVSIVNIDSPQERLEFYVNHTFVVVSPEKLEPNALIEGYVTDENGEPLSNVEVLLEGAMSVPRYRAFTDEKGHYSMHVYAHRYSDTGAYHGYSITIGNHRGAVFPKPGDHIIYNITLSREAFTLEPEYRVIVEYPTGYPIWKADVDREERYLVFASGHHTITSVDPSRHGIYLFDLNGTLLWRYPTEDQVWGIDISDDGKYVAASFLRRGVAKLFRRDGSLVWDTYELGYSMFESREIKISHNSKYVAIGTTPGDLLLLDLETGKLLWRAFLYGQIRGIVFTSDDSIIYASSGDGYVYKISTSTGEVLGRAYVEAWTYRYSLTLSRDEKYLVTASKIGRVCLVDAEKMETLWCFDTRGGCHWSEITPDSEVVLGGSGGAYGVVAFNREGKMLWFDLQYPRLGLS